MNIFFPTFPRVHNPLNLDVVFASRFKRDVLEEVQQEFLVTKTIQEVEASREMGVNFVGVFIASEDKVSQFS